MFACRRPRRLFGTRRPKIGSWARSVYFETMETILVTGASRGIGAATAKALARAGRRVIGVGRNRRTLDEAGKRVADRGATWCSHACDLSQPEQVEELVRAWPDLDGLVLNAGVSNDVQFGRATPEQVQNELQVNYLTPVTLLRHHLSRMRNRGGGRVVAVGSLTSFVPFPGNATYAASKSALYALLRSLRVELRGSGVQLGIVLAGYTDTAMTRGMRTRLPAMTADAVGRTAQRAYEKGGGVVIPGLMNRAAAGVFGAFPDSSDLVFARMSQLLVPQTDG